MPRKSKRDGARFDLDLPIGFFKVGDLPSAPIKPHMTLKEGSFIGHVDPRDLEGSVYDAFSTNMKRTFVCGYVDRSMLDFLYSTKTSLGEFKDKEKDKEKDKDKGKDKGKRIENGILVTDEIPDPLQYRKQNQLLPLDVIARLIDEPEEKMLRAWRGNSVVPIFDLTKLREKHFIDAKKKSPFVEVYDQNVTTSGSKTIGTAGDFATVGAFLSDVGNLTGNLTGTVISAFSDGTYNTVDISLNSYTLRITSNSDHLGEFDQGWLITHNADSSWINDRAEGSGKFEIDNLNVTQSVSVTNTVAAFIYGQTVSTAHDLYVHDCLFEGDDNQQNGIRIYDEEIECYFYNLIIRNVKQYHIVTMDNGNSSKLENITAYDNGSTSGIALNSEGQIVRNFISYGAFINAFATITAAYGYNTAADDTSNENGDWYSGSGNISSITPANEFYDGYKITSFSSLYGAGSNPTISGHTKYINGVDIVTGDVDIGAWGVERSPNYVFEEWCDVSSNTDLDNRTPNKGDSYTEKITINAGEMQIVASQDAIWPKSTGSDKGVAYEAVITGSYDAAQWAECWMENGDSSNDYNWLLVRVSGSTNMYALRFNETASALYKQVGGTWSSIATGGGAIVDHSWVALMVEGTTLKAYSRLKQILSVVDTSLSSGSAGIGMGKLDGTSDGDLSLQELQYFRAGDSTSYFNSFVVNDSFTETSDTNLDSHTPNGKGSGWTKVITVSSGVLEVVGNADRVSPTADLSNAGAAYTCDDSPATLYYRVGAWLYDGSASDPFYLIARYVDTNNFYALEIATGLSPNAQLYKKVSGSWTALGSSFSVSDDEYLEIEVNNGKVKARINGSIVSDVADTSITAKGKAGIGAGALRDSGADLNIGNGMGQFRVYDVDEDAGEDEALAGVIPAASTVTGTLSATVPLAGVIGATSSVSGTLSATVPLAGVIGSTSSVTGVLSATLPLVGVIGATSSVTGALSATVPLAGVIGASSSVAGILSATVPLAGVVGASSSVSGNLGATVPLQGQIDASSSVSGTLEATVPLQGQIDGQSVVSGNLGATVPLAGQIDGQSSVSGDLDVTSALAGVIAGQSGLVGVLDIQAALSGQIDGQSSVSGNLGATVPLQGQIDASSSVTGVLSATVPLAGQIDGQSSVSGDLDVLAALAGVIAGQSGLVGVLDIQAALSGQIDGQSTVSGSLETSYALRGQIDATSSVSGFLRADTDMGGVIAGQSAVSGDLSTTVPLQGQIDASSAVSGDLTAGVPFAGVISASSSLSGTLEASVPLQGQIDGQAGVSGTLIADLPLAGQIDATSSVSGILGATVPLQGQIDGQAGVSGTLSAGVPLQGQIDGQAGVSGTLSAGVPLQGQIDASSSVTGNLGATVPLQGQIDATSSVVGTLEATVPLQGQIDASSSVSGNLGVTVPLAGQIDAQSNLTGVLPVSARLMGVIGGSSFLSGTLMTEYALHGQVDGQSAMTGALSATVPLTGQIDGQSTLGADPSVIYGLRGQIDGQSNLAGVLPVEKPIEGEISAQSNLSANLLRLVYMRGRINASSDIFARIRVLGEVETQGAGGFVLVPTGEGTAGRAIVPRGGGAKGRLINPNMR